MINTVLDLNAQMIHFNTSINVNNSQQIVVFAIKFCNNSIQKI